MEAEKTTPEATDPERGQVGADAATIYERFFIPALFGQWPELVLDAAGVRSGSRILDVGCGTGVLARAAAARTGRGGSVIGVDPSPGMLGVARRAEGRVEWVEGSAERLPFADGSFDVVVSQFALMFFEDRAAGLAEMGRVLRPGGRIAVATWSSVAESPGYAAVVDLLRRVIGDDAAEAMLAPFVLGDPGELGALLEAAFTEVDVTMHAGVAHFESIDAWVHTDIRGWTLADMIDDEQFASLLEAARGELTAFTMEDGTVRFPAPALIGRGIRSA